MLDSTRAEMITPERGVRDEPASAKDTLPETIAAADLDGDGDVDLVLPPGNQAHFPSILDNQGGRSFVPIANSSLPKWRSLAAADCDADGFIDLAGDSSLSGIFNILWNTSLPARSSDGDGDGVPDECTRMAFHRGDPSGDGVTNLTDAVYILGFLFLGRPAPACLESADADNDGAITISDAIGLLNYLFLSGPRPASPGPVGEPCGRDPDSLGSPTDLGCATYGNC